MHKKSGNKHEEITEMIFYFHQIDLCAKIDLEIPETVTDRLKLYHLAEIHKDVLTRH